MSKKRILYVSPGLPIGGAEKFLVMIANAFSKHTAHQVIVSLSDNNQIQAEFDPSIDIKIIIRKSRFSISPLFEFRKVIKEEKPDVIFCINFFSYIFMKIARFGLPANEKVFISYQSTIHLNKKEHYLHKIYAKTLGKNDFIIMTSRNQAAYTAENYNIPQSHFTTLINGVDIERWKLAPDDKDRKAIRERYHIPDDAIVIVQPAKFRPEKNHTGAIRALDILHNKYNCKAYLMFVGDGPLLEATQEIAAKNKVSPYIKFAGMQTDIRPFYWAGDLGTLTSNAIETFSFATLEAMACGLPCVLTRIGGADEMIIEGKTGFLSDTTDEGIAAAWFKGLNHTFSKQVLNDHVNEKYSSARMIDNYKKIVLDE